MPLVNRTRATFRSAEFGFFGVVVKTRVHTPRRWGAPFRAGVFVFDCLDTRPLRTSCSIVGTRDLSALEQDSTRGRKSWRARKGATARTHHDRASRGPGATAPDLGRPPRGPPPPRGGRRARGGPLS